MTIRRSNRSSSARSASRSFRSSSCAWRWRSRASAAARPRNCAARWASSDRLRACSNLKTRLRKGMARNGIHGATADRIVRSITSFALYGFPESHAASFALIAYASAYLKCHHPAAFYAAMLNCYPLGFYHPATLVKDAQRHHLSVLPIDVSTIRIGPARLNRAPPLRPAPRCRGQHEPQLRLGLKYVAGMRAATGQRIMAARAAAPFKSVADFTARVAPSRRELEMLAWAGAFAQFHPTRRDALWQATAVERDALSLLAGAEPSAASDSSAALHAAAHDRDGRDAGRFRQHRAHCRSPCDDACPRPPARGWHPQRRRSCRARTTAHG